MSSSNRAGSGSVTPTGRDARSPSQSIDTEGSWTDASNTDDDTSYEGTSEDNNDEDLHAYFQSIAEEDDEDDDDEDDEDEEEEEEENGRNAEDAGTFAFEINGNTIAVQVDNGGAAPEVMTDAQREARRRHIFRMLRSTELGRLFMNPDDYAEPRRRTRPDPNRFPKVPSVEGEKLMHSGEFGTSELSTNSSITSKKKLARRVLDRELGSEEGARRKTNQRLMAQGMIPSSNADMIVHYDQPVYSGQFSDDGNFFFACVKDFKVRMYDTSNPYRWRYYKTVSYPFGQWTLTDATLSPDNKYLAYTSIQSNVCLAPTDPNDMGDPYILNLAEGGNRRDRYRSRHGSFGIWSIRYSGDGRELVAGTSANSIVVYDIESRRSVVEIAGHDADVNAVCFGDQSSPHILYSGSDDTTLKVWDRRSMGDSREAGAFLGHIEGLTYIDSKGDGRYILSNGKDQSMKLWDLRMVMSTAKFATINPEAYTNNFDYRWGNYDQDDWQPHPHDNSLVTFRGHKVLRTLIRCHFSPPGSTNSRYVYSGSEDGKVYIYNLDATLAGTVDVLKATKDSRPFDGSSMYNAYHHDDEERQPRWKSCVRDASWHPNAPVIAASSWNGYGMSCGTVTSHSWNDGMEDDEAEPKMGVRVNDKLQHDEGLYRAQPRRTTRAMRRALGIDEDEDDDDEEWVN